MKQEQQVTSRLFAIKKSSTYPTYPTIYTHVVQQSNARMHKPLEIIEEIIAQKL